MYDLFFVYRILREYHIRQERRNPTPGEVPCLHIFFDAYGIRLTPYGMAVLYRGRNDT